MARGRARAFVYPSSAAYPPANWCEIPIADLAIGDRIVLDPSPTRTRAYPVTSIKRQPGVWPYEVVVERQGTNRFKDHERVTVVRDPSKCPEGDR